MNFYIYIITQAREGTEGTPGLKARPAPGAVQGMGISRGGTRGRPGLIGKPESGVLIPKTPTEPYTQKH